MEVPAGARLAERIHAYVIFTEKASFILVLGVKSHSCQTPFSFDGLKNKIQP